MQRRCDLPSCGQVYEAKTSKSRFCSPRCRVRSHKAGSPAESVQPTLEDFRQQLVAVTRRTLESADRLDTVLGQQALTLALEIAAGGQTGSAIASLSKELRAVMAEALAGAASAVDPLDEIRLRRERKLAAG